MFCEMFRKKLDVLIASRHKIIRVKRQSDRRGWREYSFVKLPKVRVWVHVGWGFESTILR
jgi:hypothetical protein